MRSSIVLFFFFNDTATTEIYTLSLHDALPISCWSQSGLAVVPEVNLVSNIGFGPAATHTRGESDLARMPVSDILEVRDRKSTRLNSSHANISYAVFCLKKKNNNRFALHYSKTQ